MRNRYDATPGIGVMNNASEYMCHGAAIAITRIMEETTKRTTSRERAHTLVHTARAAVLLNAFGNSHYALIIATLSRPRENRRRSRVHAKLAEKLSSRLALDRRDLSCENLIACNKAPYTRRYCTNVVTLKVNARNELLTFCSCGFLPAAGGRMITMES